MRELEHIVYDDNMHQIDWTVIVGFEWDQGNGRKNADKHGVGQSETEQIFFNAPLLIAQDEKHSANEERFHALGRTESGRRLHVTFTLRGNGSLIRVISARPMHRKEIVFYEQET